MIKQIIFWLAFSTLFANAAFSQVDSLSAIATKPSIDTLKPKVKTGQEFFLGASNTFGFRVLSERDNIFGGPLGLRASEDPHWTWSFELGSRNTLSKNFGLSIGMGFTQIGMKYTNDMDSSYLGYRTVNRYISLPFRLFYQRGEDFVIQAGVGLQPRLFISSRQTEINLDDFGQEVETKTKITNGFNTIALDASVHIGFRWNAMENMGLYFIPEFRYGLLDEFDRQQPHVQRSYGLVLRWGLHWVI